MGRLLPGQRARVSEISRNAPFARRLMEMGFLPGAEVEIAHEAPWGRDPIAVRVRGGLVAVRREEADEVEVEVHGEGIQPEVKSS